MVSEATKQRRQARIAKHNKKSKGNYVFPSPMAKMMEKVTLRTQYEASMMSMSFILCGLMVSTFFMIAYVELILWYKITLIVNLLAGMVFLSSFLVTTFQQYKSYLNVVKFQEDLKGGGEEENGIRKKQEQTRVNGRDRGRGIASPRDR